MEEQLQNFVVQETHHIVFGSDPKALNQTIIKDKPCPNRALNVLVIRGKQMNFSHTEYAGTIY